MNLYYVTFGVQYKHMIHPVGLWVDPDGFLVVIAEDEERARQMVIGSLGTKWSMIHPLDYGDTEQVKRIRRFFPRGPLAFLSKEGLTYRADSIDTARYDLPYEGEE